MLGCGFRRLRLDVKAIKKSLLPFTGCWGGEKEEEVEEEEEGARNMRDMISSRGRVR